MLDCSNLAGQKAAVPNREWSHTHPLPLHRVVKLLLLCAENNHPRVTRGHFDFVRLVLQESNLNRLSLTPIIRTCMEFRASDGIRRKTYRGFSANGGPQPLFQPTTLGERALLFSGPRHTQSVRVMTMMKHSFPTRLSFRSSERRSDRPPTPHTAIKRHKMMCILSKRQIDCCG